MARSENVQLLQRRRAQTYNLT